MPKFVSKLIFTTIAAMFAGYLLDGVYISNITTALIVAIVLGLLNTFIKPLLVVLTLPITVVTLGLFLLVINIILVKWVAAIVPGFDVNGWFPALLFSIIVSIVTSLLEALLGDEKDNQNR